MSRQHRRRQAAISSTTSSQLSGWRAFAPKIISSFSRVVQIPAARPPPAVTRHGAAAVASGRRAPLIEAICRAYAARFRKPTRITEQYWRIAAGWLKSHSMA
jgi:hypothetical protein